LEAERPRGLEVEDQLELRWRLNRQFARLLASQDAIDIPCRSLPLLGLIDPIRHQAARGREKSEIDFGADHRHVHIP
jgi:hypothetical protein